MNPRKPLFWVLSLLVFAGTYLIIWPFLGLFEDSTHEYFNRIPFDSASWKDPAQVASTTPVRVRMVDDLLKRHRLIGMSRQDVDDLLGAPTAGPSGNWDYIYYLGPERSFIGIDSEWLVIKFTHNKVMVATIARD